MKSLFSKSLKNPWAVLILAVAFTGLQSCSSDDDNPDPVNEEETITTMRVTLVPITGATVDLLSQDLDGDGPNNPEVTVSGPLQADMQYTGVIEILNETENPVEDITEEIREEDDEHQFFFTYGGNIADHSYLDSDGDGNPLGLNFQITTGAAGNANLTITLRHEPKKPNDGTLVDAGGETDIAQTFPLVIE